MLTKPGIIFGNLITTIGGYLLASKDHINPVAFLAAAVGISLVIASGCTFNNYIDRRIDRLMERTKNRALAKGTIPVKNALVMGIILIILGLLILAVYTNLLTAFLALIGFIFYVIVYGYFKRHSIYGTIVGSIPGAIPLIVGYTAAINRLDMAALILFLIMVIWQMPHFYAIAIFRLKDYENASIPVLPAIKGINTTKIHILFYTAAFAIISSLLTITHNAGYTFLIVMVLLGILWFWFGVKGFKTMDNVRWAKKMFSYSLINLLIFSLLLSINMVLP